MAKPFYSEGTHTAEIIAQELSASSKKGTPQLVLKVKILGIPNQDGTYETHREQYERYIYIYLTQGTMPFALETLKTLGFTGTSLKQLDPNEPNHQDLTGGQIDVYCSHEEYEGKDRERWQVSNQQSSQSAPIEAKKMRALDALFGKGLREQAGGKPSTPVGTSTEPMDTSEYTNQGITDDDIPF